MRNSALMRRHVNVLLLDFGRVKSDLEAIREISQEEIYGHSYFDYTYHFVFPPTSFLEDDLLMVLRISSV